MSLRTQLLLMALIVALPCAGSIAYSGIISRQRAIEDAVQEARKIEDHIANEQKQLAVSAEQLMSALAQLPEVKNRNAAGARQIFHDILDLNPQYVNISVADRSGTVWASAVGTKHVSMSDRKYFKNAMATGRLSSGEYIISRVTSRPTFNVCYPFKNRDQVISGVIIVDFSLEQFDHSAAYADLQRYSYLVCDHDGTILNKDMNSRKSVGEKDDLRIFRLMQGPSQAGSFVGRGLDGREKYITYRKLYLKGERLAYLYIRSEIPVETVVAQANGILGLNLLFFTSGLAGAFSLAWLIGKRSIIDPISKLQDASRRLASGDLRVRVSDAVEGGELGQLGKAFDEMAQHLTDREQERAAAEAALGTSESHYRSIFDNSLFGIAVTGKDKKLVQANAAFCRLFEYEVDELVGVRKFTDLTFPDDREKSREMYRRMVRKELTHYTLEKRYLTKSGKVVRALCFVQGMFDEMGAYTGHSACILDITALKESEERMRLFFERQLVGTAITSPEKGWIMTNAELQRMLGYTGWELAGTTWEALTHPDDLERDLAQFDRLLSGEIEAYSLEKRFLRKDGTPLHTELSVGCVRRHDGFIDYVMSMIKDISLRKEAERELHELHLSLEVRVRERTRLLEAAIKEQESFSYSVSHDLRSPLRHINSHLAILLEDFGEELPVEARVYLNKACAASSKMGKLIDALLELSRVSRAGIVRQQVDLSALAVHISDMLQETEPARAVEFVIAGDLVAQGDKNLLRLVLMNLLGNAWKYTSRKDCARVEFGEAMVAGQHAFFVRDNGAGFDMAYQDKLFGTFQRLHGNEYEGTGIGLATVKRIMERHCGTVWGVSEEGNGATFYFSLPGCP